MRRFGLCALAMAAQLGCSAIGLDDYTIPTCESHADCDVLNADRGLADPCLRYFCNAEDNLCRLQAIDLDRDGHAASMCANTDGCSDDVLCDDCDDSVAATVPGAAEVCDGFDNDCDFVVDDVGGDATPSSPETLVSGTGAIEWHAYGAALSGSGVQPIAFGGDDAFFNVAGRDEPAAQLITFSFANLDNVRTPMITADACVTENHYTVTPPTDVGPGVMPGVTCETNEDCWMPEGNFCNGFERCSPTHTEADDFGCVPDNMFTDPTTPGRSCTSADDLCLEETDTCVDFNTLPGCQIADLATAEFEPGTWFGAALRQTPCREVRIGYFTENQADGTIDPGRSVLLRGDYTRSNSYTGIDVDRSGGRDECTAENTGASRPPTDPLGARLPAIAALAPDTGRLRPQALAAWLASNQTDQPTPVEILGVWQETFSEVLWVNATNNAVPQRLDSIAVGDVRPVVLSFDAASRDGYIVAYGAQGGGVALRFVPAFPDDDEVVSTGQTLIEGDRRRVTEAIADLGTEVIVPTSGDARHVDVVLGAIEGDATQIAIAWNDDGGVKMAVVSFDAASPAAFPIVHEPQTVADGAEAISIAYTSSGVVLPGFSRGGMTADETSDGGWLVAWTDGGSTLGARFSELDGARMEPATMRLGSALARMDVYIARFTDAGGVERDAPHVSYSDATAMELRALSAFCGPPQ